MSDYREPWSVSDCSQRSVFIDNCGGITVASASQLLFDEQERVATAERIVGCVNALAGRDPAKLEGLLEAVRAAMVRWDSPDWKDLPATATYMNALRAALAAFEGDVGDE